MVKMHENTGEEKWSTRLDDIDIDDLEDVGHVLRWSLWWVKLGDGFLLRILTCNSSMAISYIQ